MRANTGAGALLGRHGAWPVTPAPQPEWNMIGPNANEAGMKPGYNHTQTVLINKRRASWGLLQACARRRYPRPRACLAKLL
jgi:hypothetical protein